jgi:hypothetical protein
MKMVIPRQVPEYYLEVGHGCLFSRRQCCGFHFHAVIRRCIIQVSDCMVQYGPKKHSWSQDTKLDHPNTRGMTLLVTVQNKFGALPPLLRELTVHPGGGGAEALTVGVSHVATYIR